MRCNLPLSLFKVLHRAAHRGDRAQHGHIDGGSSGRHAPGQHTGGAGATGGDGGLRDLGTMTSTLFWTISHVFLSSIYMPPHTDAFLMYSSECPCVLGAACCLHSDVVTMLCPCGMLGLQAAAIFRLPVFMLDMLHPVLSGGFRTRARQRRHYFWTISHVFLSSIPPHTWCTRRRARAATATLFWTVYFWTVYFGPVSRMSQLHTIHTCHAMWHTLRSACS